MAHKTNDTGLSFEESLKELEVTVRNLEGGELTLETSIAAFEKGMALARDCEKKLAEAKAKVEKIIADESGTEKTVPFEPQE